MVGPWSAGSRRRLLQTVNAVPWDEYECPVVRVDLTYPEAVPPNAAVAKGHLRAWLKRYARHFQGVAGFRFGYYWKMEFQDRGAIHFHLALLAPPGVDIEAFRLWLSRAWFEVVGSGDEKHLRAGTTAHLARDANWASYFAGYAAKGSKEYQHRLPDGWEGAGRWWGYGGVVRPVWSDLEVTAAEASLAIRTLRRGRRAQVRASGRQVAPRRVKRRRVNRATGEVRRAGRTVTRRRSCRVRWLVGGAASFDLFERIVRALGVMTEARR
jgi:hypothetical protein